MTRSPSVEPLPERSARRRGPLELSFKLGYPMLVATGLTIGAVARAAGVPISTVRYYERAGLLRPSARSVSNYRLYAAADLQRLRFIRAAQETGFTLEDITHLLRPASCHRVQKLIEDRLDQVEARMKVLRHVRHVLRESLEQCRAHEETGRCKVVVDLSTRAKRP